MRAWKTALWLIVGLDLGLLTACTERTPASTKQGDSARVGTLHSSLNTSPRLPDFALLASNSIVIDEGASVLGADVGVINALKNGSACLDPGYEISIRERAQLSTTRNVIADSVRLGERAKVGDVQSNELKNLGATFGKRGKFVALPPLPTVPAISVGTSDRSVPAGAVVTLPVDTRLRRLTLGEGAKVLLAGGTYQLAELVLREGAQLQALAPSDVRVAGRLSVGERASLMPAPGLGTAADALRITVAGTNGGGGGPGAAPAAASIGDGSTVTALVLVPNGTLSVGERAVVRGALFGKDLKLGERANVTFSVGFTGGGCGTSCDDQNPCTADRCVGSTCSHTPTANGSACNDNNACTQSDTCNAGVCTGGNAIVCSAQDQCHVAGTCNPASGVCTNPLRQDGSPCQDGNVCTTTDACLAGVCTGSGAPPVDDHDPCTIDSCSPTGGVTHSPAPDGTACTDGNQCTTNDTCQAGACTNSTPVSCAGDACHNAGTCDAATGACIAGPAKPDGSTCSDGTACTAVDICRAGVCTGGNPIVCVAQDECHTAGSCDPTSGVCSNPVLAGATCAPLPVDPATIAPPLDPGVAMNLFDATTFLYSGANPIQTGVAPNTIQRPRAAVLRGRALTRDGAPLPGVVITIKDHPEYGTTHSRADGWFDLAVNGGQTYTVDYKKAGYLPIVREAKAPWLDYVHVSDAALIPSDSKVTLIDLTQDHLQVAAGSLMIDGRGARQLNLLFKPGTRANITPPSCTTEQLDMIHVRTTEYTVGPNGLAAMAAPLPPSTAYSYAVEMDVDEAVAAGTMNVEFSQPVIGYLDNFLAFPVGSRIPFGLFNRNPSKFTPQENVQVLGLLPSASDLANIDLDGDGEAEADAALDAIGISADERAYLKQAYTAPKSLWRGVIPHFSWGDWNGPPAPPPPVPLFPPTATYPSNPQPSKPAGPPDCPDTGGGCIVELQKQVLGERLPISGTPFSLVYRSDRVQGKPSQLFKIPVSGETLPFGLKAIEVCVSAAGYDECARLPPDPNQVFDWAWKGRDAYDRRSWEFERSYVAISYMYDAYYASSERFGDPANGPALVPAGFEMGRVQAYQLDATRMFRGTPWDARGQGLGGWTLDVHHVYDPQSKTLRLGNGSQRTAESLFPAINQSAGTGNKGFGGDGGPAKDATLNLLPIDGGEGGFAGVSAAADGGYYIADVGNCRVRHVDPNGTITTVAGSGVCDRGLPELEPEPDACGGLPQPQLDPLALDVDLTPIEVSVAPDGSVYVVSSPTTGVGYGGGLPTNYDALASKIYRLDPSTGTLRRVAGNGFGGSPAEGIPATDALLHARDVAVDSDGSIIIADTGFHRIRRVAPGGVITTIAGTGARGFAGDGAFAEQAQFANPTGVAIAPDSRIYVADQANRRIRVIQPDGLIDTVAGAGAGSGSALRTLAFTPPTPIASVPAHDAVLNPPMDLAFAPDGSLYIAELQLARGKLGPDGRVRKITPGGMLEPVAGGGLRTWPEGGSAMGIQLGSTDVDVSPSGSVLVEDVIGNRINRVATPLPGVGYQDSFIPSADGAEVYVFDRAGRHQRTLNALTGGTLLSFGYDAAGRLTTVTDGDDNVTTIQRDAQGKLTAFVNPYELVNEAKLDANGYLAELANPAGEITQMGYGEGGLLESFIDPRGGKHQYSYDAASRLIADKNPTGATTSYERTDGDDSYAVEKRTPLERISRFEVSGIPGGARILTNTAPDGTQSVTTRDTDDSTVNVEADGSISSHRGLPDPRFGMLSPLAETTLSTPNGLTTTSRSSRRITQSDPNDPQTLTSIVETHELNGDVFETHFDTATRTLTRTSAMGRSSTELVDTQGRVVRRDAPGMATTLVEYDERGRISKLTQGTPDQTLSDGGPRVTSFTYNTKGRIEAIAAPLGSVTQFLGYDEAGRAHQQVLPGGRTVQFGFDAASNVTSVTPPGRPPHELNYTPLDQLSVYDPPAPVSGDAASWQTDYEYDVDQALDSVTRPETGVVDYGYDSTGRLTAILYPSPITPAQTERTNLGYDDAGRVSTVTATGSDVTLSYEYDGSLVTREAWSGAVAGSVQRELDRNFRVVSETLNDAGSVAFGYDSDGLLLQAGELSLQRDPDSGQLTAVGLGSVVEGFSYSAFGELKSHVADLPGEAGAYATSYERDQLGRITQKLETIGGVTTLTAYGYDAAGRLEKVSTDGIEIARYGYDLNGNRTSKTLGAGPAVAATFDDQDRLLTDGDSTFTYTANGELLTEVSADGTTHYRYDALGNLRQVVLPDATSVEYLVDGRNRRVGKKVNGTLVQAFIYGSQLAPVAELDGTGNVVSRFVYGTKVNVPEYMIRGGEIYRIVTDHLGSPRLVVNASTGEVKQRIEYDAWGVVLNDTAPAFQPFGFAGGIYETVTGLVRFGARDYAAASGRWTAKDPLGLQSTLSLFAYVQSDPQNAVDPTGLRLFVAPELTALVADLRRRSPLADTLLHELECSKEDFYFYANSNGVNRYDSSTNMLTIDPTSGPRVPTAEGLQAATADILLAHELGHAYADAVTGGPVGDYAGGPDGMAIVSAVENPIRVELGYPLRTGYGNSSLQ